MCYCALHQRAPPTFLPSFLELSSFSKGQCRVHIQLLKTILGRFALFHYKMTFFKWAWWKIKVQSRPVSLLIPIRLDQIFKMRYIMSLNSHQIQKYQPSKLNVRKKIHFSSKMDLFFNRSNLMACTFGSNASSETYCTSF